MIITVGDALLISLVGFAIVFAALIILMFTIRLISATARMLEKKETPVSSPVQVAAAAPAATPAKSAVPAGMVPAKGSLGEMKLFDTDEKTAAMLMAIVADELKAPLNELRFVSIRTK